METDGDVCNICPASLISALTQGIELESLVSTDSMRGPSWVWEAMAVWVFADVVGRGEFVSEGDEAVAAFTCDSTENASGWLGWTSQDKGSVSSKDHFCKI